MKAGLLLESFFINKKTQKAKTKTALTRFDRPVSPLWEPHTCVLWLQSDYHFEYTECDALGSRWRVAVPNKADVCTGLPNPVHGTQCSRSKPTLWIPTFVGGKGGVASHPLCLFPSSAFSCNEGEFLDMQSQRCKKCAAGTYSLGTGVAFDEWDRLPPGFTNQGVNVNQENVFTNCSGSAEASEPGRSVRRATEGLTVGRFRLCSSTWTPKGDYISSNVDECTATLFYAVNLKKPGIVSFEYFYPDNGIYFEFFVSVFNGFGVSARGVLRSSATFCRFLPPPRRFRTTSAGLQTR